MPYYLYNRKIVSREISYTYAGREISIAGCKNGIIASELRKILAPNHTPPLGWKIPIARLFNDKNQAIVVDLNPKGGESSLGEIDTVFGFSYEKWSPIMLRLKLLTYWDDKTKFDEDNISFELSEPLDTVYTVLYLRGSFENCALKGTWNLPGPAAANALLWFPEATSFFTTMMQRYDPDCLLQQFKEIGDL
jgi:hypothetical protein